MASFKKTPTPKKPIEDLEAKGKILKCLAAPKKPMQSDYKCTMMNPHCAKMSNEILENEDDQMSKFCLEAELSLEQLHGQTKIQMVYAPKAWEVVQSMVNEKTFQQ
jgi:chaperonin GroEL (HSP60 family)